MFSYLLDSWNIFILYGIAIAAYFLYGSNLLILVYVSENSVAFYILHVYTRGICNWLCIWWSGKFSFSFSTIILFQ